MISFGAAVIVGTVAGNDAEVIVVRATLTMIVCWFIGRGIGGLAQRDVDAHIERYKQAHPIPENRDYGEVFDDDGDKDATEEETELQAGESGGQAEEPEPQPEVATPTTPGA